MKFKLFCAIAAIAATILTGCKTTPTPEQMSTTSYTIGVTTAIVANQTKLDDVARGEIIAIMNKVSTVVPETNQTFETVWTPIATEHVTKLIAEKKITDAQGLLIKSAFSVVCKGIDYIITIRFPKSQQYAELVQAATHGFCDGFLSNFKPAMSMRSSTKYIVDAEAMKYLTMVLESSK